MNYSCEAFILASVPPTEENTLLFENVDLSFDLAVMLLGLAQINWNYKLTKPKYLV